MRPLIIALVLALAAASASAEGLRGAGRGGAKGGTASGGTASLGIGGTTPNPPLNPPFSRSRPPGAANLDPGPSKPRKGGGAGPPAPPVGPVFPFFHGHHDDDDDERIVLVPVPPPPAPPPPEPAEPPPPPEPGGPVMMTARGATPPEPYAVGEPLSVPFVTLHWRQYGLPEPPAGLIYARVGRDVLLIEPVSRVVRRRLDPAELREDAG